tara:strand:+ start:4046 stop:4222 length:177 start_codon:yes stop_codon:yes gene_type:complete
MTQTAKEKLKQQLELMLKNQQGGKRKTQKKNKKRRRTYKKKQSKNKSLMHELKRLFKL